MNSISRHAWVLCRPDGTVRSRRVVLAPDGRVIGYDHPNEAFWTLFGYGIAFLARDGQVTSVSHSSARDTSGSMRIAMMHPHLGGRPAHVLVELPNDVADANEPAAVPQPETLAPPAAVRAAAGPASVLPDGPPAANPARPRTEFVLPDAAAGLLNPELARVFLIANNPAIGDDWYDAGLSRADMIVQFNRAVHFERLADQPCHKMHVFAASGRSCWGFTEDGEPEHPYERQQAASLILAVLNWLPEAVRPYWARIEGRARLMEIYPATHIPLFSYPAGRAPSVGFATAGLLRTANWLRRRSGGQPLELVLVGFTGNYPAGQAWAGHDFAYEQECYRTWCELRRL